MNYTDASKRYATIKSAAKKSKIQRTYNAHDIRIIAFQKIAKSRATPPHTTLESLEKTCGHQHNYKSIINTSKDLSFIPGKPNLITFTHLVGTVPVPTDPAQQEEKKQ